MVSVVFRALADAKQWLIDASYKDPHEEISHNPGITVQLLRLMLRMFMLDR